jgi:hypothetical protein
MSDVDLVVRLLRSWASNHRTAAALWRTDPETYGTDEKGIIERERRAKCYEEAADLLEEREGGRAMSDPVAHIKPLQGRVIEEVLLDVAAEIDRQDSLARAGKFDNTHILPGGPDLARLAVTTEEVGEVAKEVATGIKATGYERQSNLYEELIQTAACYTAWATAVLEERP